MAEKGNLTGLTDEEKGQTFEAIKGFGTAFSAMGTFRAADAYSEQGEAILRAREWEARQYAEKAKSTRATATRAASEERRRARYTLSKFRAKVAAGGGGTDDPTTEDIAGDIGAAGERNALMRMFEGAEVARGLEDAGTLRMFEGRNALLAGRIKGRAVRGSAYNTLLGLTTGGSLLSKYGEPANSASLDYATPYGPG